MQRGIRVSEVIARTLLSPRIVDLIDRGHFEDLPGGLYARSYVRAFAGAVGLDPEEAVREVAERLPPAEDPLPTLREVARAGDPAWLTTIEELRGRAAASLAASARAWTVSTRRAVAVAVDAAALLAILLVILKVTAWTCRVTPELLLETAGGAIAVFWGILVLLYFGILGTVGKGTPGAIVSGRPASTHEAQPRLRFARSAGLERREAAGGSAFPSMEPRTPDAPCAYG
jgi:hypothetical protein